MLQQIFSVVFPILTIVLVGYFVSVWETAGLTQLFQVFRFQILR